MMVQEQYPCGRWRYSLIPTAIWRYPMENQGTPHLGRPGFFEHHNIEQDMAVLFSLYC